MKLRKKWKLAFKCCDTCYCLNVQKETNLNWSHKSSNMSVLAHDKQDTFLYLHHTHDVHTECTRRDGHKAKMRRFVDFRNNMDIDQLLSLGLSLLPLLMLRKLERLRKGAGGNGIGAAWGDERGVGYAVVLAALVGPGRRRRVGHRGMLGVDALVPTMLRDHRRASQAVDV
jgi:hypothetical protein